MKVGIICVASTETEGATFLELLSDKGVSAELLHVYSGWEKRVGIWIDSCTHFMVLPEKPDFSAPWFNYLAGFCSGSSRGLLIFSMAGLPPHFSDFPAVSDAEAMIRHWLQEKQSWEKAEDIRMAKEALAAAGLFYHPEDLARMAAAGEQETVELFMRSGMSADTRNRRGVPLLSLAVRGGHRHLVEYLLSRGCDIDAESGDRGNTALMDAAAEGELEIAEILIRTGAGLDVTSRNGQTALILAVGQGNLKIAALLIKAGSALDIRDSLGMSAYDYAKLFRHRELLSLMDSRSTRESTEH
ncbi:ankyrin repeat domain-containing protein [Marispirochaeta aestuarii]|uniref:ankyrin repeat domain-containing protein n=1 Tax=Marispirochaeta aestuarii TaxID=1963862 RepID=UPI0029C6C310|nr:ankyrin repeat domain-containing protein [Marispirochaeta aestuarii]